MIRTVEVNKTVKEHTRHCDDCDTQLHWTMACSAARCEICGKELCEKCIGHENSVSGDYREVYCKRCWNTGEEYRSKIEQFGLDIDKLYDEWHTKCLNHK